MTVIYIRMFNLEVHQKSDTGEHKPSKYFPKSMVNALKIGLGNKGYIRQDDYIIGPVYSSGEFQIGMTGTIEKNESPYHAICREMGEEIGLVPKHDKTLTEIKSFKYQKNDQKITFTVYDAYIKHCVPVLDHQNNAVLSQNPDSTDKVGCFIYGAKKDILSFLDSHIYRYKSSDDIVGLAAIKAEDIWQLNRF